MKLIAVTADEAVVAIFNASRRKDADKAAALVGGEVSDFGNLNEFKSEAASLPRGAKAFYCLIIERAGKIARLRAEPLLTANGKLQTPRYFLESYQTELAKNKQTSVRKSHWRLYVNLYADSEETAVDIGRTLKDEVFKKAKPNEGTL